ncbi:MAG: ferritin-like domain-containing protein [Aeromonas popoffii]|uniref:ferritin-like domain-containing protein n=1 Tax=Aeromonas popoffii TaxID=70856 RepID=UPI003F3A58E1
MKKKNTDNLLEVLAANMVALQMQAKMFHLNVSGPRFYGDHKTYDGIYEFADEWFDVIAERMRTLNQPVCVCPQWVMTYSMLDDSADEGSAAELMAKSILQSMKNISSHVLYMDGKVDPTTISIVQDLDAELGKHIYFVQSSI